MEIGQARNEDLGAILELQQQNLARNLAGIADGFVTVEHTPEILRRMHALEPSIVAREGERLAGYALVMPAECREFIPVLRPMFARLDALGVRDFYVMGQVCVAPAWRGKGVFDGLYRAHRDLLGGKFSRVVTEVSARNPRSLRAHYRVGFRDLERYRDATDEWALMAWDWS